MTDNKTYQLIREIEIFLDKQEQSIEDEVYIHPDSTKKMRDYLLQLIEIVKEN